ncbi:MAG: hypothetical protein R3E86_13260 [Pseudomonadales bacterium]
MDTLSWLAVAGLERVAIIAGALVIGYWGYRLYARDKRPGLVFMGIACALLVAALFTTNSHVRSLSESYQVASATPAATAEGATQSHPAAAASQTTANDQTAASARPAADVTSNSAADGAAEPLAAADQTAAAAATESTAAAEVAPQQLAGQPLAAPTADSAAAAVSADQPTTPAAIASSQELGGRIVSVRSKNVSLEWSKPQPEN